MLKKEVWERCSPTRCVIIRLQEFPHWVFLFHCRLLTSSANLRVSSTSVRSQPCFNVTVWIPHLRVTLQVQKGVGPRSHPTTPLVTTIPLTIYLLNGTGEVMVHRNLLFLSKVRFVLVLVYCKLAFTNHFTFTYFHFLSALRLKRAAGAPLPGFSRYLTVVSNL